MCVYVCLYKFMCAFTYKRPESGRFLETGAIGDFELLNQGFRI